VLQVLLMDSNEALVREVSGLLALSTASAVVIDLSTPLWLALPMPSSIPLGLSFRVTLAFFRLGDIGDGGGFGRSSSLLPAVPVIDVSADAIAAGVFAAS
jgi:hypothetical protein